MSRISPFILVVALLSTVCGCRMGPPQYEASAVIQARPDTTAELEVLQATANAVVTNATHQVGIERIRDTHLLRLSVTTANPELSALLCNRIAAQFIADADVGDTTRQLIDDATPPRTSTR